MPAGVVQMLTDAQMYFMQASAIHMWLCKTNESRGFSKSG